MIVGRDVGADLTGIHPYRYGRDTSIWIWQGYIHIDMAGIHPYRYDRDTFIYDRGYVRIADRDTSV